MLLYSSRRTRRRNEGRKGPFLKEEEEGEEEEQGEEEEEGKVLTRDEHPTQYATPAQSRIGE